MLILGIDPGSQVTGWGVVEAHGAKVRGVAAGVLKLGRGSLESRLTTLFDGLEALIEEHTPDEAAVEDIFYAKHPNAALKLGHARGVALVVLARAGVPIAAYPPAIVKRTVAGRGLADKAQVARLVGTILGWKALPAVDATDALAVAITHARAASVVAAGLPMKRRRR
jgi:crossover junction endodeoxyribonuclease RuvC